MRMIAKFAIGEELKFCSHLDTQRIFIRGIARANIPVEFSQGYNKHPKLSMALALPVGETSESEYIDIAMAQPLEGDAFVERMNRALPQGIRIRQAKLSPGEQKSLTALVYAADYRVVLREKTDLQQKIVEILDKDDIIIDKKTKAGIAPTDIRGMILKLEQTEQGSVFCRLRCGVVNLKPRDLMQTLAPGAQIATTRTAIQGLEGGKCTELFSFF